MRNLILTLLTFFPILVISQTTMTLDFNNAKVKLSDNGVFFNDPVEGNPGYEIPAGEGNHMIYSMALWMTGIDADLQLHGACNTYADSMDMYAGPISDNYDSDYYTSTFGTAIWKISQAEIQYHTTNYTAVGYSPAAAIANWPGNGNTAEGVAAQLAPYVDVNGDLVYDPMAGDYPYIQGDGAIYVILNDEYGPHAESGADALGVEIHVMFYQFDSLEYIDNTTFMNAKVFNRRDTAYTNFRLGAFMDFDLGFPYDDYIGCDSTRNLVYIYNSTDFDPGISSQPGFASKPPAFGAVLLNKPLDVASYFNSGPSGSTGDPSNPVDYHNYLRAVWKDGTHLTNNGGDGFFPSGYETNYAFTGNPNTGTGWTEENAGNSGGDRRMIMSTEATTFNPGADICLDVAFIYTRDGLDNLFNVSELFIAREYVQDFYDNNILSCEQITANISEPASDITTVYPNPSAGSFFVVSTGTANLEIRDLNGRLVYSEDAVAEIHEIDLIAENGLYILSIRTGKTIAFHKIQLSR